MKQIRTKVILLVYIFIMMFSFVGCTLAEDDVTSEIKETGAWEHGTIYYNGYQIDIVGPEVGHPSGDSLWSTYYEDDKIYYNVDFYGIDGSLEDKITELSADETVVVEGVLWGNDCYYYIDEATIAMISLGKEAYLQVEFIPEDGSMVEFTRVPAGFELTITKQR